MNANHIYKVSPVQDAVPPNDSTNWDLSVANKDLSEKYGDRKVLLVKHVFANRLSEDSLAEGDGSYKTSPEQDSEEDFFYIDVPKHFFEKSEEGKLGDFIAKPEYTPEDVLHVRWTGWGRHSGWIDLNVQQRGAGVSSIITEGGVACAKWS
jgi:hypothetical protein